MENGKHQGKRSRHFIFQRRKLISIEDERTNKKKHTLKTQPCEEGKFFSVSKEIK